MDAYTIIQGLLLLAFAILGFYAVNKISNRPDPDAEHK